MDLWPHPLTAEGRRLAVGREGQTIGEICHRENLAGRPVRAWIDGVEVPAELIPARVLTTRDRIVTVQADMHDGRGGSGKILRQLLSIAVVAASVFLPGALGLAAGSLAATVVSAGVLVAGSLLINAIVPPEQPRLDAPGGDRSTPVYSLAGGGNRARLYAPLLLVLGSHRVFPDIAAAEYTTFEDDEQYLHGIYDFGLGDLEIDDLRMGPTPLADFGSDVQIFRTEAEIKANIAGNVDTLQGGVLTDTAFGLGRVAENCNRIQLDFVGRIFKIDDEGETVEHSVTVEVRYQPSGGGAWASGGSLTLTSDSQTQLRRTLTVALPSTRDWRVQVRRTTAPVDKAADDATKEDERTYDDVSYTALRAFQPDTGDYAGRNRIGIRFKASAHLQGRLDRISGIVRQKVPTWDGSGWTAPQATSNPAWIFRWFAQGFYTSGLLDAGRGLTLARIDDSGIKAWGAWCQANALTCNYVIDREQSVDDIQRIIARCGRASPSWLTGKFGVVYNQANLTPTTMVHPGNILLGSFGVEYVDSKLADEVIVRYIEPSMDWQWNSIRRRVPGAAGNLVHPETITLSGVTDAAQAAGEAALQAASHKYHRRRMSWSMAAEGMALRRGNVVYVNHSLILGGENMGHLKGGTAFVVELDQDIELSQGGNWLMLRLADRAEPHVSRITDGGAPNRVRLANPLPKAPDADGPPFDILWRFYNSAAELKRVKIIATDPKDDRTVDIVAIDERPEYYAAAAQSETAITISRGVPRVIAINAVKRQVRAGQGNVLVVDVTLTVAGRWQGGQIRVGRGTAGSVRVVKELRGDDISAEWVEDPRGTITITAIPYHDGILVPARGESIDFNLSGRLYDIDAPTDFAAVQLQNGVRRFDWTPPDDPDLAGIVIRHLEIPDGHQGEFVPDWGTMTPSHKGVLTSSPWETEEIPEGEYALAARAISTDKDLSAVVRGTLSLTGILAIPNREFIYAVSPTPTLPANQLPDDDWPFDQPGTTGGLQWTDAAQSVTAENKYGLQSSREIPVGTAVGAAVSDPWLAPVVVSAFGEDGVAGASGEDGAGIEFIFATTSSTTPPANPSDTWGFDTPGIAAYITHGKEAVFSRGGNSVAANSRPSNAWAEGTGGTVDGRTWSPTIPSGSGTLWKAERDRGGAGRVWAAPARLTLVGSASSVWRDAAPTLSTGQYLWMAQRRTPGFPQVGQAVPGPFTSPRSISRQAFDGQDGDPGDPGTPGATQDVSPFFNSVRVRFTGSDTCSGSVSCPHICEESSGTRSLSYIR